MKVADILAKKGSQVVAVTPATSVIEVLKLMAEKNIGSVVVLNNGSYQGLVTERDYSRKVILNGKNSTDTKVADIMTTDLPSVTPADSIDHCMALMGEKHIRYLPVFTQGSLAGIISMSDVVTAIMLRQQETINHLEQYISGT